MYDAIVVGARCAGATTAMLLARRGHRVLLVDRARFPSDLPHGHFIHRSGPRYLRDWGLLDRVASLNSPAVTTMVNDYGDVPLVGRDLVVDGVAFGYAPRRQALDAILVEAAVESGAEFSDGFAVDELVADDGQIAGVRGRDTRSGVAVTEKARVTVGADGRNSRVARSVQAPAYEHAPSATCWYFSYWAGVPADGLEFYVRTNRAIFAFPTSDGLFAIFVAWPRDELPTVRADVEGQVRTVIERIPTLAERVERGRRVEPFYGAADLPNFLRKPYGPGWALVGDAGCHKDPFLALGICDAFRDSALLADALDDGLSGRLPLDSALADYERRRNEATLPEFRQNLHLARFGSLPPEARQLRAALHGNQEATNRFIMANEGMIAREEFYNPAYLERLPKVPLTAPRMHPMMPV